MGVLLVIAMYALWANAFAICKITLVYCPPFFLIAARMLVAAVLLLGFVALRDRSVFRLTIKQFCVMGFFGIVGFYLLNALEYWSLQYLSAGKSCFLYSLSPFLSAFFSYLHFNEKMNKRKWIGLGIGVLGIIPVLCIQTSSEALAGGVLCLSWPEIAMFGAVLCSSYGWVLLRLLIKDASTTVSNGIGMLVGGFFALGHSYLIEHWDPLPVAGNHLGPFLLGLISLMILSNLICNNLYGSLLRRFTATFLSFMGMLSPFFASLSGWLFLGEVPSMTIFLSTGVLILGLWLVYNAELQQGYILKKRTTTF